MENALRAKDLRIGNYIGEPVSPVTDLNIICGLKTLQNIENGKLYNPIPLTEQWLLRGGFELRGNEYFKKYTEREEFVLTVDRGNYYLAEYDEGHGFQAVYQPLQYVHQLQNIIHSLNGQELEFKD